MIWGEYEIPILINFKTLYAFIIEMFSMKIFFGLVGNPKNTLIFKFLLMFLTKIFINYDP